RRNPGGGHRRTGRTRGGHRLNHHFPEHAMVAYTTVLMADDQVLPGPVEPDRVASDLTRDQHQVEPRTLDVEAMDDVHARRGESHVRSHRYPYLAGNERPGLSHHYDFVRIGPRLPHARLVEGRHPVNILRNDLRSAAGKVEAQGN